MRRSRQRSLVGLGLLAVALVLVAGGLRTTAGNARETKAPTYYQHVKPIVDGRCTACHVPGGIAPFSLRTYSQARVQRNGMAFMVSRRLMPPWHADPGYRRYLANPSLTRAQISTITRWAAAGGPKGNPRRPGRPLPPVAGGLSRDDVRLALPTYTPKRGANDDYHCFVIAWPQQPQFITGLAITPGERREVHHIILYGVEPNEAGIVDNWDAREPGPGYGCYGGPSATGQRQIRARLLGGWAPGSAGSDTPTGTGSFVTPGSRLIVQMHYNVSALPAPRPDRSALVLKVDDTVQKRGGYAPVSNLGWFLSPESFRVPAGRKRVVHSWTGDPRPVMQLLGWELDLRNGFMIHSVLAHMHGLGERARITLVRSGGRREVLLNISRWDFNWQRDYRLATPVPFHDGDQLSIRCEHDNSRANQPVRNGRRQAPRNVTWGENTRDEMCVGFVYVSEL